MEQNEECEVIIDRKSEELNRNDSENNGFNFEEKVVDILSNILLLLGVLFSLILATVDFETLMIKIMVVLSLLFFSCLIGCLLKILIRMSVNIRNMAGRNGSDM